MNKKEFVNLLEDFKTELGNGKCGGAGEFIGDRFIEFD